MWGLQGITIWLRYAYSGSALLTVRVEAVTFIFPACGPAVAFTTFLRALRVLSTIAAGIGAGNLRALSQSRDSTVMD